MTEEKRKPRTYRVDVCYERKKFKYGEHDEKKSLHVLPGDTIKWTLKDKEASPFSIVIKALVSPLDWSSKSAAGGDEIVGIVQPGADPGLYPYAFSAFIKDQLLVDDPEIIIPPPKGGRG